MTGIFGILESSATQWYQDVALAQEFFSFFIVTSIVYDLKRLCSQKLKEHSRRDTGINCTKRIVYEYWYGRYCNFCLRRLIRLFGSVRFISGSPFPSYCRPTLLIEPVLSTFQFRVLFRFGVFLTMFRSVFRSRPVPTRWSVSWIRQHESVCPKVGNIPVLSPTTQFLNLNQYNLIWPNLTETYITMLH
jgi:hypothetical protein